MAHQLGAQGTEYEHRSSLSLISLPYDIQTYLLSFVPPLDILHLRMACRWLYEITRQQIVWIEALRQICLVNTVFLPTFPFNAMSLPELEHAAMAPYKWLSMAYKGDPLPIHRTRYLAAVNSRSENSDEMDVTEDDDFEVRSLFLVPGGRYLVTFAWRWVCVWDLGFATPDSTPRLEDEYIHEPLAKARVNLHSMQLVHASPDGQALRIFVSCPTYRNEQKLSDMLYMYEIYPQHEEHAQLDLIARLEVVGEDEISFYSISGDCFIFLHGSVLKIWNFKTNGWTSWTVQGEFHQVIITPTLIFLIHSAGLSVWRIPRLMYNAPLFSFVNPTPLPPVLDLPYTGARPVGEDVYGGPSDWYSGTVLPITYDVATTLSPDALHLQRYEIELVDLLTPAALTDISAGIIPAHDSDNFELKPYRFCMDSLVTWWYEAEADTMKIYTGPQARTMCNALADEGPTQRMFSHLHGVQTAAIAAAGTASTFCPVSGRFVYLDDEDDSLQGVNVVDFLLPLGVLRSQRHHMSESEVPCSPIDGRWRDDLTRWNANLHNPTQF